MALVEQRSQSLTLQALGRNQTSMVRHCKGRQTENTDDMGGVQDSTNTMCSHAAQQRSFSPLMSLPQ